MVAFPAQGSDSKAKVASLVEKMMTNAYAYGVCDALEALEEFDRGIAISSPMNFYPAFFWRKILDLRFPERIWCLAVGPRAKNMIQRRRYFNQRRKDGDPV
ncbi:hypothetical protein HML84_21090 [Alcanivorax sp. IO_7]|nr:hypothetical protein HML84_21090 [Alcanivorax sp. IO_7]